MDLKDSERLGKYAEKYWYFTGKKDLLARILRKSSAKNMDILVVGCGVGDEINQIAEYGRITALDPEEKTLKQISDKHRKINAKIEETEFNGEYDLALALDVMEHIKDDRIALEKIHKSLRKGGTCILTVPAHPKLFGPHDTALGHHRRYAQKNLTKLLTDAGFRNIKTSYWNSLLLPGVCAVKISQKLLHKKPRLDCFIMPSPLNKMLAAILLAENRIREHINLPVGITIVATAEK
jgi:2-polyprenyl-3-methyl-5-hydroxy-6-metoxy-1,4-benzoquinol methylase